jgi:predicted YcjX-like family ATPase
MMRRRYDAYRDIVVRPFFNDHFLRLDRQVVLIDALAALNAGPRAMRDLQDALARILDCFDAGRRTLWSAMLRPRADRILFAATKADHVHQSHHEGMEAILRRMTSSAAERAKFSGALIDTVALASVRATREASVRSGAETLPAIVGVPVSPNANEAEIAAFAGDVPDNPDGLFETGRPSNELKFMRFRPPLLENIDGVPALPHIRLDRAMQFLIGDKLQ